MHWQNLGIIVILKWNHFLIFLNIPMDWAQNAMWHMIHMQWYVGGTTTELLVTVVAQNWKRLITALHMVRNYWKNYIQVWHIYHLQGFFLHFFWKGKKYMKSIMLSLNTDCRLQRYLWHRTATCSIYNYVVWVCTRTTALSCYLLMINDVIHYL